MRTLPIDLVDPAGTLARIRKKLDGERPNECWTWTGATDERAGGYGMVAVKCMTGGNRYGWRAAKPHRVVWTILRGPIPDGLVIDHVVCGNRRCCNPAHLEVVTQGVNASRSAAKPAVSCLQCGGQDWQFDANGNRRCRTCRNNYFRQWQRDQKPAIECPECGALFQRTADNMRFCSDPCRRENTLRRRRDWARAKSARLRAARDGSNC